jgi:hypothetical protein
MFGAAHLKFLLSRLCRKLQIKTSLCSVENMGIQKKIRLETEVNCIMSFIFCAKSKNKATPVTGRGDQ